MNEKENKRALDRLAALMKKTDPARLRAALVKSSTVSMRTSDHEKADMQKMATTCGLTLTEYLTRLHYFANELLAVEGGKRH